MNLNENHKDKLLSFYNRFEKLVTIVLSIIIMFIILIALYRIVDRVIDLFISDFFQPVDISFEDYQEVFGKIMTLLISLEFLNSIIKVIKTHKIRALVLDVCLITGLAISRKLIVYDYDKHDAQSIIALGGLLVATSIFYYLVKGKISDNKLEN